MGSLDILWLPYDKCFLTEMDIFYSASEERKIRIGPNTYKNILYYNYTFKNKQKMIILNMN